jgi:MscS family membrane protein
VRLGRLDLYQWLGLVQAVLASWAGAWLAMRLVSSLVTWVLHRAGSALSIGFVAKTLKPFTWLAAVWIFFLLLGVLDLPVAVASAVFAAQNFVLAGLFAWVCMRMMDLIMGIYTNSELLRPHRNLGDMIVPVAMRLGKTTVVLVALAYVIYQVGEIELLGRFLTGLGVAGLAASLAAQDVMKSFFGTLLLIGERVFRIGDRIRVGDIEGVVEQVGFRSTRLRTGEGALLTVPNSVIASYAITNRGKHSLVPFQTAVEVSPETPAGRVLEFRDRLQGWLTGQTQAVRDKVECQVQPTAGGGVEVRVSLWLAGQAEEGRIREVVSREILRLAGELGVSITPSCRRLLLEADSARGAAEVVPQAA